MNRIERKWFTRTFMCVAMIGEWIVIETAAAQAQSTDSAFVTAMIPHHQHAIDMARIELRDGRNEQLRRMAQEIIVTQLQEIQAMRRVIGERQPSPASPNSSPMSGSLDEAAVHGAAQQTSLPISHRDRVYAAE